MKNYQSYSLLFIFFFAFTVRAGPVPDFVLEAREVTELFQSELKKALMSAMESGGPQQGVKVCQKKAVEIAEEVSHRSGWRIRRISLKNRSSLNEPQPNERKILELFAEQATNSKSIDDLEWWEKKSDKQVYMKAIPTNGLCLTCHGDNVDLSVKKTILHYYPNDKAVGYTLGEIRGAFVLDQSLSSSLP